MAAETVGSSGGSLSLVEIIDRARTKMNMLNRYIVDDKKKTYSLLNVSLNFTDFCSTLVFR